MRYLLSSYYLHKYSLSLSLCFRATERTDKGYILFPVLSYQPEKHTISMNLLHTDVGKESLQAERLRGCNQYVKERCCKGIVKD